MKKSALTVEWQIILCNKVFVLYDAEQVRAMLVQLATGFAINWDSKTTSLFQVEVRRIERGKAPR